MVHNVVVIVLIQPVKFLVILYSLMNYSQKPYAALKTVYQLTIIQAEN